MTAATIAERDDRLGIEIRYQDENVPQAAFLVDTVEKARDARDLGVTWSRPLQVVIVVRDLSLATARAPGLAKTTGTVAVAIRRIA